MELFEKDIYKRYKEILKLSGAACNSGDGSCANPSKVSFSELVDKYDAFCFDGYGTLYNRGDFVYPGAMEWFDSLRKARKPVRLITNAASDVDAVLAADAAKRGFDFTAEETISSGSLLKDLVKELRGESDNGLQIESPLTLREVYYIGRETGKHVLESCGIKAVDPEGFPREPVVAVSSAKETAETYARAVEILQRPGAILLVLNSDAWAPKIDGTREPVSGALGERLRLDSRCETNNGEGCKTYYLGKPFPAIWRKARASLPMDAKVLMIGDTLGTDVLGARVAGFHSALVVGRNQPAVELEEDQNDLGVFPDYYL